MTIDVVILGAGVVGQATASALAPDVRWQYLDPWLGFDVDPADHVDVALVCTPCRDGEIDCWSQLAALMPDRVIVRSTVPPQAFDQLGALLPRTTLFHWPEWLTERSKDHDAIEPDKVVIGVMDPAHRPVVEPMMSELCGPHFPIPLHVVDYRASTAAKIAVNSYYSLKCWLMNMLYEASDTAAVYSEVCQVMALDQRIQLSHHRPWTGGYLGFGGKCLPKDLGFLADHLADGKDAEAVRAVLAANEERLAAALVVLP
jgi:UDPglucose 6-dehydrogenase